MVQTITQTADKKKTATEKLAEMRKDAGRCVVVASVLAFPAVEFFVKSMERTGKDNLSSALTALLTLGLATATGYFVARALFYHGSANDFASITVDERRQEAQNPKAAKLSAVGR